MVGQKSIQEQIRLLIRPRNLAEHWIKHKDAEFTKVDCYNGGTAYFTSDGLLLNKCDCDDCPNFIEKRSSAVPIESMWDEEGYSWIYETNIPHETFEIFDGRKKYCRGIVFALNDVPRGA